jgi:O-antigen/teichoic acid export membrane protein
VIEATGDRIAKGAAWMIGARLADRAIGLVGTVILARLLTPADFGLVAMATAVIGLIELASAFGFEVSLIRKANPTRDHYDTVWTLNVLFSVGCGAITAALALPAAAFYGDQRLVPILVVLGAAWAIGGLSNVGIIDFQRTLNFAREFQFLITRRFVGSAVTISLALWTRSYWALIAGLVALRLTGLLLSYLWHPFRPRMNLRATAEIFSFSVWIFVDKLANFGSMRASDFVLGSTHGPAEVGLYRIGDEIGHLPGTELVAPLNRAILPGVSQMIEGGRPTRDLVVAASGVVGLILIPACLGISAIADPLVRVMLGDQWLAAVPLVQILAINSMFLALWANQHATLFAVGKPHVPGLISVAKLCVFALCVFLLVREYGAQGVAVSALLSSIASLGLGLWAGLPALGVRLTEYFLVLWRPLVAGTIMWLAVSWLVVSLAENGALGLAAINLLASIAAGCLIYLSVMSLLYLLAGKPAGTERLLLDRISLWFRQRTR